MRKRLNEQIKQLAEMRTNKSISVEMYQRISTLLRASAEIIDERYWDIYFLHQKKAQRAYEAAYRAKYKSIKQEAGNVAKQTKRRIRQMSYDDDDSILSDSIADKLQITQEITSNEVALKSFIALHIIPELFEHTKKYYSNYKNLFDQELLHYFVSSSEGTLTNELDRVLRKYGMPVAVPAMWLKVGKETNNLYRDYLNKLVGSRKRSVYDVEKYAEYFLRSFSTLHKRLFHSYYALKGIKDYGSKHGKILLLMRVVVRLLPMEINGETKVNEGDV